MEKQCNSFVCLFSKIHLCTHLISDFFLQKCHPVSKYIRPLSISVWFQLQCIDDDDGVDDEDKMMADDDELKVLAAHF